MGLFGLSQKEKLDYTINQVNYRVQKVQDILDKNGMNLSNTSYAELMELKHLGEEILTWMNKVTPILERNQKLMLTHISGLEEPMLVTSWMMLIMEWYRCFDNEVGPYIPIC